MSAVAESEQIRLLSEAFKQADHQGAERYMCEQRDRVTNNDPFGELLLDFTVALLRDPASSGQLLELSSIEACVRIVHRHLGPVVRNRDLLTLPSAALEAVYREAIDMAARHLHGSMRALRWALKELYRFSRLHSGAAVDENLLFWSRGLMPVNARIFSLDECIEAVEFLFHEPDLNAGKKARASAVLTIILGFGASARTMEAIGLRDIDVIDSGTFLIVVHALRGLKTPNANRIAIIMLPELIPYAEEALKVLAETTPTGGPLLFGGADMGSVPKEQILRLAHTALRVKTGDMTAHNYMGRHAFASILELAISCHDISADAAAILDARHPRTKELLKRTADIKWRVVGNNISSDRNGWARWVS